MRPTIDEQLTGAARLLRLAEDDDTISPGVAELVRNARRLVDRVAASWSPALPFLRADNARLAALLDGQNASAYDADHDAATVDLAAAAARNEELRALLVHRIQALPAGPERAAIGAYLRERVATDPT